MNVAIPQLQLKRTAQKKSPASVGALPIHGPRPSEKDDERMTDSTPATGLTNRAPIFALENPALELERFASILTDLTDDLFDLGHRAPGVLDGIIMVRTRTDALDNIEFIVGKVYELAKEIGDATTRAVNAQIVAEGSGAVSGGKAINQLIARLKGNETPMQIVQVAADLARGMAA